MVAGEHLPDSGEEAQLAFGRLPGLHLGQQLIELILADEDGAAGRRGCGRADRGNVDHRITTLRYARRG